MVLSFSMFACLSLELETVYNVSLRRMRVGCNNSDLEEKQRGTERDETSQSQHALYFSLFMDI